MKCPICKNTKLKQEIFHNVEVDYCPTCLGIWFNKDELRWAKDNKDKDLNWMDIDLWKDQTKFKVSRGDRRVCPSCRVPLYEVYYGDSGIIVDVCNLCEGVWLDRKEFLKITSWLKDKADYEILHNYSANLVKEFGEVFLGPESLKEEASDLLTVLKMLNYKLMVQRPLISKIILNFPK
jgi:uncharacterized protein